MTDHELAELIDLLGEALADESVAGIRTPGSRTKRYGTDFTRALDGARTALEARGVEVAR